MGVRHKRLERLHNVERNKLFSRNIMRMIKSRRKRWAEHVAGTHRNEEESISGLVVDSRKEEFTGKA